MALKQEGHLYLLRLHLQLGDTEACSAGREGCVDNGGMGRDVHLGSFLKIPVCSLILRRGLGKKISGGTRRRVQKMGEAGLGGRARARGPSALSHFPNLQT